MILVTGANGLTGRSALGALARRGLAVRAMTSNAASAAALRQAGSAETCVADFRDPASLRAAMAGISAVLHICPRMKPDESAIGLNVIEAARATPSVRRFVLHGVINPQLDAIAFHAAKRRVDEALILSGLPFVILQPTNYMQNVAWQWPRVVQHGELLFPYSAEVKVAWLDVADYAEAIAAVLADTRWDFGTYECVSTERPLDRHAMAAHFSSALGRPVRAASMSLDEYFALPHWHGRDPRELARLRTMFETLDRHGHPAGNRATLAMLLERTPTSYQEFARRFVAERRLVDA